MEESTEWGPGVSLEMLRFRAGVLRQIREFFHQRGVMEVITPVLGTSTVTDLHIQSFSLENESAEVSKRTLYLQTSPEFFMKRLLAAKKGSGAIYQMGPAFRRGEAGQRHNPEFLLLEWYRPGFTMVELMQEVLALVAELHRTPEAQVLHWGTYRSLFERYLGVNPHALSASELLSLCERRYPGNQTHLLSPIDRRTRENCLEYLFAQCIQPELTAPQFVTQFPASQAALSEVAMVDGDRVAQRFEFYWRGMELANGYQELRDADELASRMKEDNHDRQKLGLAVIEPDRHLLAAMRAGLPECTGVAMGIDRLVACLKENPSLEGVIPFAYSLL